MAVLVGLTGALALPEPAFAESVRQAQWYLGPMRIAEAQAITKGQGVRVAVVDSPIYAAHPDLAGQVISGTSIVGSGDGTGGNNAEYEHGTCIASIIAGKGGSDSHLLGIAPGAQILPVANTTGSTGDARTTHRASAGRQITARR